MHDENGLPAAGFSGPDDNSKLETRDSKLFSEEKLACRLGIY
jgi:hypothetical protein